MKACKAGALKNVLILVAACVIGYELYGIVFIGYYFIKLRKDVRHRRTYLLCRIDHHALLAACREISEMVTGGELNKHQYLVRDNPDPEISRFPQLILELAPTYVNVDTDGSVMLEMLGGLHHYGVKAYPEDFKASSHYFEYGDRKLIEGLWYYDDGYHDNEDFYKTIEAIIQKGKK